MDISSDNTIPTSDLVDPPVSILNEENPKEEPEKKTNSMDALVEAIERKQKSGMQEYHFRPVYIDGVYCYIVLYLKHNMLTIESIHIKCNFYYNGQDRMLPYILYHHPYSSIKKAVIHVQRIHSSYRLMHSHLNTQQLLPLPYLDYTQNSDQTLFDLYHALNLLNCLQLQL